MTAFLEKLVSHSFMVIAMLLCFGVLGLLFMARVRRDRRRRDNELPERKK